MDLLLNTARQSFWWCFGTVEYPIWADWLLCGWIHVPTSVVPPVFSLFFFRCDDYEASVRTHDRVCMCWHVYEWTLDHQLISHAGRHQRRFELTLRVGAALHAIRNFTSLPLQRHQTYMPIHIEMNRWSFAMQRIAILHWEKIKLQKSGDTLGSVLAGGEAVYRRRWSEGVLCLCESVGKVQVSCFFLLKQVNCVYITAPLQKLAPFLLD